MLPSYDRDMRILDGGLATELQRRGFPVRDPWWASAALRSVDGQAMLRRIHAAYLRAGATVLTANTFRCNLRALHRAGLDDRGAAAMVASAVSLARAAAAGTEALVAASLAPVEDCYRPELVPDDAALRREHRWLADRLAAARVDLILVETMNTTREAVAAVAAARETGTSAWVSFVCTRDARLLSGEDIADAAVAAVAAGAEAVLVNCTTPADTGPALDRLRDVVEVPIGAYPNLEDRAGLPPATPVDRPLPAVMGPAAFAALCRRWREEYGLRIVGGCCGTRPDHIAALRHELDPRSTQSGRR